MDKHVLLGVLVYCASFVLGSSLFPALHEVQYTYQADVHVGTEFPVPTASQFTLRGLLKVQATDAGAVLQLTDITTSLYNGVVTKGNQHWTNGSPLPEQAAELYHPFTVHLKDDAVTGLSGVDGEGEWSVNIKRALASLMQLETSKLDTPAFFAKENGLYGYCDAEYSIVRQDESYIVRKNLDHSSCKGFPSLLWSNVPSIPQECTSGHDDFLSSSSERVYTLNAKKNIMSIVARGGVYSQLNRGRGELHYVLVNQTLVHKSKSSISTPAVPSTGALTDLIYRLPGRDLTQGRNPLQQSKVHNIAKELLVQISRKLDGSFIRNKEEIHDHQVDRLISYLRVLDRSTLRKFFDEFVGTSYQQETARKLFLECLPRVGTTDAILFIRDLIIEKRISDATEGARLIMLFPFYVREPSEALLRETEIISMLSGEYGALLQRGGVLSFATLIFHVCKHHCTPKTQEMYVRKYLERFTGAADFDEKMLYLQGLSNIQDGKVFDYMEGLIKDFSNPHIRLMAVWATLNTVPYHPDQTYKIHQPILANVSEPLEMRVAALIMVFIAKPSYGRLFSLHWFMTNEKDPHLKHFYYTTLQSLANTKDPCYSLMKPFATRVLRLMPPPTVRYWASGNYLFDHSSDLYGFGSLLHIYTVGDSRAIDLPSVFVLTVTSFGLGIQSMPIFIYLKLVGIVPLVRERLSRIDPKSTNIPQLADILRKMKADPTPTGEVHVEIIIAKEDRVLSCLHFNETTLHLAADGLSKLYEVNFIRYHDTLHIDTAIIYEHTLPTDLGIPALMEFTVTSLMSLRGEHSQEATGSRVLKKDQLELQRKATAGKSLCVYNPVLDMWQGVQRSTAMQMVFPINTKLMFDPNLKSAKLSIIKNPDSYLSGVIHVHTTTFVWGEGSDEKLQHYCPSCNATVVVTKGDSYKRSHQFVNLEVKDVGIRVQGEIYDCEHYNFLQTIESIGTHQNYQVFPVSRPLIVLAHVLDSALMNAPPGSCGFEMKLMTNENQTTELEGSLQLTVDGSKTSLAAALIHKAGESTLYEWKSNIHYLQDDAFYNITLDLMRHSPAVEGSRKLCLDLVIHFPAAPSNKYLIQPSKPATAEVTMNWSAAGGQMVCGGEPADQLPFKVSFIAETVPEQKQLAEAANTWPFNACKTHQDTLACHEAAHEMATLRKYSVALNFTKPIESEMFVFARTSDGQLVVSAEVSPTDPLIYVTMGSDRLRLDNTRHWLDPLLLNTHYPVLNHIAMRLGLIKPEQ